MKIKYNKGFTLLEVLIAISILTIIIFIGYRIIDKSTIAIKNQGNINKGQMTMNNLNTYLTKDLEQATSIKLLLDGNLIADTKTYEEEQNSHTSNKLEEEIYNLVELKLKDSNILNFEYEYIIRDNTNMQSDNGYNRYLIEVNKSDGIDKYSISKTDKNNVKIDFVNNQVLSEKKLPFVIIGNNPYQVTMRYNGKDDKLVSHEFKVASRYITGSTKEEEKEEEKEKEIAPPVIVAPEGFESIVFWAADKSKCESNNLYTSINGKLSSPGNQYDNGGDEFTITTTNSHNGNANSGYTYSSIGYPDDKKAILEETYTKPNNIEDIYIYVSKNTSLSLTQLSDSKGVITGIENLDKIDDKYNLSGGDYGKTYKCILSNNNKKIFNLKGVLSIEDKSKASSGYISILYGEKK